MTDIRRQVERSSLGTPSAQAARRSVPRATASKVVARAAAMKSVRTKKLGS